MGGRGASWREKRGWGGAGQGPRSPRAPRAGARGSGDGGAREALPRAGAGARGAGGGRAGKVGERGRCRRRGRRAANGAASLRRGSAGSRGQSRLKVAPPSPGPAHPARRPAPRALPASSTPSLRPVPGGTLRPASNPANGGPPPPGEGTRETNKEANAYLAGAEGPLGGRERRAVRRAFRGTRAGAGGPGGSSLPGLQGRIPRGEGR